jgi:hypothetical protein
MAMANQHSPPPGSSAEGVGGGRGWSRVLINSADRPRKKLIYITKIFILIFYNIKLIALQKQ